MIAFAWKGGPEAPHCQACLVAKEWGPVRASNGAPNFLVLPHIFYASLVLLESEAAAISHKA